MNYFKEDAIKEMTRYFKTVFDVKLEYKRVDFTEEIMNKMFICVFNSEPKFEINANSTCFDYIKNRADVLYEIIMTLREHNYCQGTITQTFNNYWFYVGSHLLNRKEDTILRIIEKLHAD
jgi:hypothetical protein